MSCLKKLLLTTKAWKVFTKLQSKLHSLQRPKYVKKPNNRLNTTSKSAALWQPLHFTSSQRKRRTVHAKSHSLGHHRRQKRPAPVFIDELFIERIHVVKEQLQQPTTRKGATEKSKKAKLLDHQPISTDVPRTSKEEEREGNEKMCAADDMWESLALASPQLRGINERADEFISRFRAEMLLQETLARQ